MKDALPQWRGRHLGTIGVDLIPIQLTPAAVNVNLTQLQPTSALPQVTNRPEKKDDRDC